MHYHKRDAAHSQAMIQLRAMKPSESNPVPVLVACWDRRTGECNRYEVHVVIKCLKCAWKRDVHNVTGRREVPGVIVKVMHADHSDTLARVMDMGQTRLDQNEFEMKCLTGQREDLLNQRALEIETALLPETQCAS